MSISQLNNNIEHLNKDIASLQEKLAREKKNESDKRVRINNIRKSINKNTSTSTVQSKERQCSQLENDIIRSIRKQADLQKEIARKQNDLSKKSVSLSKERTKEEKRRESENKKIIDNYEKQVKNLKGKIEKQSQDLINDSLRHHIYVQNNNIKYDVFISHASEDKESFVNDFVAELQKRNIKVWYDNMNITWGDSLRTKIDEGLRNSRFGIVVLSKDYIKKGWTQYELEGLFNIEMTQGKTILPIWHNITKSEVLNFSPTIGGRLALNTSMMTPSEIADEVLKIIQKE